MLGAKALHQSDLLKKVSGLPAGSCLCGPAGKAALGPEDIFSQLDSGYAFFTRMPQKRCAHHATPIWGSRKWGQRTHLWLQNANKVPRGGRGGLITGTGPRGRPPLWFWGFAGSHFLLTSWKPLGGIQILHLFFSIKGNPWLPLGLSWRGRGRRMPLGIPPLLQGLGTAMYRPQGYFKDIC